MTPPQETFFHPLNGSGHGSHPSLTARDREPVSVLEVRIEPGDLNPRPLTPQSVTLPTLPWAGSYQLGLSAVCSDSFSLVGYSMSWWMVVVANWLTWCQGCLREVFWARSCSSCTLRAFLYSGKQALRLC